MASFLAFAWRKTQDAKNNDYDQDISLGVTASSSGDTLTNQSSQDSMFDIPAPSTPEGFRRRKSPDDIRRDLHLPQKNPGWKRSPCMDSQCSEVNPFGCGSMFSPQVSTSSFYSRSTRSAGRVAKSPDLKIGKAKTAVGALLAMNDAQEVKNDRDLSGNFGGSILPPRFWIEEDRDLDMDHQYAFPVGRPYESFHENKSEYSSNGTEESFSATSLDNESTIHGSPSSNILCASRVIYNNQDDTCGSRRYIPKDDSFLRVRHGFRSVENENMVVERTSAPELNISGISHSTKDIESLQSLVDDDEYDDEYDDEVEDPEDVADKDNSYTMRIQNESRDFHEALRRNKIRNQRRMQEDLLQSLLERLQDTPELVLEVMGSMKEIPMTLQQDSLYNGFPKEKRATICQIISRILAELRMVLPGDNSMTLNDVAGFVGTTEDLAQTLSFCLSLVRMAIPPSEKPAKLQYSTTGIPEQGHKWKCVPGFRAALGFEEEPMSPEMVRGGETCLFSLPSESAADNTPHTSNVSLPTTITSAFSPEKSHRHKNDTLERNSLRRSLESVSILFDKLSVFLVDLVESASDGMRPPRNSFESLQSVYLEMEKVDVEDLKALIDSFELDLLPMKLTRLVTEDKGDYETKSDGQQHHLTDAPPLVRSKGPLSRELVNQTMSLAEVKVEANVIEDDTEEDLEDNIYLFSPSTEDMNSIERTFEEVEDLRRTVGSFDDTCDVEEREAPPALTNTEVQPRKKNKPKRSMWRRRISRRHKVAE